MKKTFYTLIILFAFGTFFNSNQVSAQCTIWTANGGNPWGDFNIAPFAGAPCDDGTGCVFNEITAFEIFASEAYSLNDIVTGVEYTFSACNGPGVGSWNIDFAIVAPSGAVDAFGAGDGDGCSITWTATENGTYLIVINEAEQPCGGGPNTAVGNGFPAITCVNGPTCDPNANVCNPGTLTTLGFISVCDLAETFDVLAENDTIPTGGGYAWSITDDLGGTGGAAGGITLTGATASETFNADLNGVLSANMLEPLSGPWVFRGLVLDAVGAICGQTADSLVVRFGTESPTIVEFSQDTIGELTVFATGGVEPYSYLWDDPAGQTTQTAVGLDPGVIFTVTVIDANGCITSGESQVTVSTKSISSLNEYSIVPNPNNGSFSVQLNFDYNEQVEVEVLDITGRVVERASRELTSGNFEFNLNSTAAGVYFVRITAGAESLTERIIVSN